MIIAIQSGLVCVLGGIALIKFRHVLSATYDLTWIIIPSLILSVINTYICWANYAKIQTSRKLSKIDSDMISARPLILVFTFFYSFILFQIILGFVNSEFSSNSIIADGVVVSKSISRGKGRSYYIDVTINSESIQLSLPRNKWQQYKEDEVYQFVIREGLWCSKVIIP